MLRFVEHFFCGSRYWSSDTKICGCFWEIGNSYGSNEKALEVSVDCDEEILPVENLWVSSTGLGRLLPMVSFGEK